MLHKTEANVKQTYIKKLQKGHSQIVLQSTSAISNLHGASEKVRDSECWR